jgi:hypothetical protein
MELDIRLALGVVTANKTANLKMIGGTQPGVGKQPLKAYFRPPQQTQVLVQRNRWDAGLLYIHL